MRRIVWVGHFGHPAYRTNEEKYADALARAGAEVIRLNEPWDSLEEILHSRIVDTVLFSKCQTFPLARLKALPDLVARPQLVQVLFDLMDFPERRVRGIPWPTRRRLEWWLPMARSFDAVLLKDRGLFELYEEHGVSCTYLDEAAEPLEPEEGAIPISETHDVAFIGMRDPSRWRQYTQLARGLDAVAYGHGWERWRVRDPHISAMAPVHGTDFVRAVRSSKVVWAENRRHDVAGYWSDRVYRVLAAGGVFLTRYTEGLGEVFEHRRHLMWYRTLDEARAMLEELLEDPSLRSRLRVEGQALIESRHTYDHRAKEMLRLLDRVGTPQF